MKTHDAISITSDSGLNLTAAAFGLHHQNLRLWAVFVLCLARQPCLAEFFYLWLRCP
jgi:hypothetical protein